jgi:peptidyl-prolyl cis-trans isomerase D
MIENLRKNLGPIAIGVVLSFVLLGFVLQDRNSQMSMSGSKTVIKVDGRSYDGQEFHKLGSASLELAMGLGMYDFLSVIGGFGNQDGDNDEFFVNRMTLREAKEQFGIHPGEAEIDTYIKEIRAFAGQDGKFDAERYREIVEKHIGRMGLGEKDLRELAADALACRKLGEILGTGLGVDRDFLARSFAISSQQISGELARLDAKPFEEKIQPTEEEVKAYWETLQDSFKTEPKRKFTYFIANAQLPEVKPAEGADAAKEDAKVQEERRRKKREFDSKVDDFLYELEQKHGAGFEDLAKGQGFEVKTTELFPASAAPADLAVSLTGSGKGGRAVDSLFAIKKTDDPFSKISEALPVGEGQWLIARLDDEEPARVKTFEEARDQARVQYVKEKGAEALRKAADENAKKLKDALAAGKSFGDAAKELGLTATPFNNVTAAARPDIETQPSGLFRAVSAADPGTVSEPVVEGDRAFLVYVAKREVVKSPDSATRIDSMVESMSQQSGMIALQAWLAERAGAAKVERLYKQS